ncbi:MAG: hypothetical protein Fur0010_18370 [Bdellovibrio sp.]
MSQAINFSFPARNYESIPEIKSDDTVYPFLKGTKHFEQIKSVTKLYKNKDGEVVSVEADESQVAGSAVQICDDQTISRSSGEHIAVNLTASLNQSFKALEAINEVNGLTPSTFCFGYKHVAFWETSFVASHEFGHKIFEHNFPKGTKRLSLKEVATGHACFTTPWNKKRNPNKGTRVLTKEDILGAYNEGFTDMFAFYSLKERHASLKNVPWFEKEREVDSLIDDNNDRKVYDKKVATAFFLDRELSYRTDADAKFQDGHTIGAIFAANINFFMDSVGIQDKLQKLKITMRWLKSLQVNFEEDYKLTEYAFVFKIIERFVDEVKIDLGVTKLDDQQKAVLVKEFPHYQFEIMQNL